MGYTSGFTAVTGAIFTAAQYNTYTRDNLAALWVFTTAGDLIYATSSTTVTRLPKGADGTYLKIVSGLPAWGSVPPFMTQRKGASSPDWSLPGTVTRAFSAVMPQVGVVTVPLTFDSGAGISSGVVAVTFPTPYSNKPIIAALTIKLIADTLAHSTVVSYEDVTTTGFNIYVTFDGERDSYVVSWFVIGPP